MIGYFRFLFYVNQKRFQMYKSEISFLIALIMHYYTFENTCTIIFHLYMQRRNNILHRKLRMSSKYSLKGKLIIL